MNGKVSVFTESDLEFTKINLRLDNVQKDFERYYQSLKSH